MYGTVRRWMVAVGVGVAALAVGAGGAAVSLAGAPATTTVVHAAGDCMPTDCGANHNQVLV